MSAFAMACTTAMQKEGVAGVAIVDAQGLIVHTEGAVPDGVGGAVAEMAVRSLSLVGADAVVTVEAPSGKVIISRSEGATIALFMNPK